MTTGNSAAPTATVGSVTQGGGSEYYRSTILADSPSAYWRFGESTGTTATAELGPNGTYTGGVTLGQTSPLVGSANTAMLLDGTSGYVSVPSNAALDLGDGPFTLEAWIKRTAAGHTDEIFQKTGNGYRIRFGSGNTLVFSKGSAGNEIVRTTSTIADTNWHHVVVTRPAAGTPVIYFDGAAQPLSAVTAQTMANTTTALTIGTDAAATPNFLGGRVDEAALYKTVLTATQVSNHYQAAINPPAGGGSVWTVNATVADDVAVSKVEFYVDGNLFATDTASPWTATVDTLAFPVYDGSHTITVKSFDADGNSTLSTGSAFTVANGTGIYKGTITSSSTVPSDVYYDPALGTQDATPMSVTITNTSASNWPTASVKLRYQWIAADNTVLSTSSDISIGSDLAAAGNRVISGINVAPPTLPTGVYRGRYKLRFDLYSTATPASYFSAQGVTPLEYRVTATRVASDRLGLERFQQYDGEDLGGGADNAVNLANGNNLVQWVPFNQPGRGLNTVTTLTYNSLEQGSVSPMGNGWSLAISSLSPFGTRLDVHPNAADTAAGRTAKWIGLTDADGTFHKLVESATANIYTPPAGVHLYIRDTTTAGSQRYKLVKPDRTTFWYGDLGYPTSVVDQDGNTLTFTLGTVAAGDDAYGASKQITTVTDAASRTFTIAYYTKTDTGYPAVRGKVKTITDHVGHRLRFDYYNDGSLLRLTEEGGTNADGSYLADRSIIATYLNVAGTGPAIPSGANRANPDPATVQGSELYSLIDYRAAETSFAYSTTGATAGRVTSRTNRAGSQTTYAYNTGTLQTTVGMPLARNWVYTLDSQGKVLTIDDPVNPTHTTVTWTADNMPSKVTEPTGAHTDFTYNPNGYLLTKTQLANGQTWTSGPLPAGAVQTVLSYQDLAADGSDTQSRISRVTSVTQPAGAATTAKTNDYKYDFTYVDNLEDHVASVQGPDPDDTGPLTRATTTNTWNLDGTLASTTLPSNGDGITRTTTYNTYDGNGLPTQVTDAAGKIAKASYQANGNLDWLQDPNHNGATGLAANYQQQFFYDSYGRLGRSSQPKSTAFTPGVLVWTGTVYDANDNPVGSWNPHYGTGDITPSSIPGSPLVPLSTVTYDAMDRPLVSTGPAPLRTAAPSRPKRTTTPPAASPGQSSPTASRPRLARRRLTSQPTPPMTCSTVLPKRPRMRRMHPGSRSRRPRTGSRSTATTSPVISARSRGRRATRPRAPAGPITCPAITTGTYTPTNGSYTGKFDYDFAHRQIKTTDPQGNYTKTTVNENGAPLSVVDWVASGSTPAQETAKTTSFTYNDRGEKTTQVSPFDSGSSRTLTSKWTYDTLGNIATVISPRAYDTNPTTPVDYVQTTAYDALNRPAKITLPKNASTAQAYQYYAYDSNGNQIMVSLPTLNSNPTTQNPLNSNEKTTVDYWDTGQIYASTDPANPKVRFDYTAEGWQSQRIPEKNALAGQLDITRSMFWDYLPDGLLKALRDVGGQRASYAYDANGNRTTINEANGITQAATAGVEHHGDVHGFNELKTRCEPEVRHAAARRPRRSPTTCMATSPPWRENAESGSGCTNGGAANFTYTYDTTDRLTAQTDDARSTATTDDEQFAFTYTPRRLAQPAHPDQGHRPGRAGPEERAHLLRQRAAEDPQNYDGTNTLVEDHTLTYTSGTGAGSTRTATGSATRSSESKPTRPPPAGPRRCQASWAYDPATG